MLSGEQHMTRWTANLCFDLASDVLPIDWRRL